MWKSHPVLCRSCGRRPADPSIGICDRCIMYKFLDKFGRPYALPLGRDKK